LAKSPPVLNRNAAKERIPLAWAIQQPNLLKPLWDQFSVPQKVLIKAAYGLPLETQEELNIWSMFQGSGEIDELGYPTSFGSVEYEPFEYSTIVGLIGRRAGKSFLTCFMVLYECLFGGHLAHVKPDQDIIVPYVCYDLATAKANMRYISILANEVPSLKGQIVTDNRDKIEFANGIVVQPEPPTIKTGRGIAVPVVVMDEVGFWYKTADNANPDVEVARALRNAQTQFAFPKQFIISTPYTEEGMLWMYAKAGTKGRSMPLDDRKKFKNVLVVRGSTAMMENPEIAKFGREKMQQLYNEDDPNIFQRESLALFVASESNFIPGTTVDQVTDHGVKVRRPSDVNKEGFSASFVAVMDPAFRYDDFVFGIFHRDSKGHIVQDLVQVWTPDRKLRVPLNPAIIMNEIAQLCKEYNIPVVYSDQHQLESLKEIALQYGLSIIGEDFTGSSKVKIYGSLEQMLRTRRIHLLDIPEQRQQLTQLNKRLTALQNVQISAPPGKHDDIATVVALGTHKALQFFPSVSYQKREESVYDYNVRVFREKARGETWDY
jgi:hypothetical protein